MRFHAAVARIGQTAHTVRAAIGGLDQGMRVARAVHNAVKPHMPSKIAQTAERGLSSYEAVREKIRQGGSV